MAALADVPQVILITTTSRREWTQDANNALIYDTAATHPNVQLVDWNELNDLLRRRLLRLRRHPHEIDGRPVLRRGDQQLREAR